MGIDNCDERRTRSNPKDAQRRRQTNRRTTLQRSSPRQVVTRSDTASTGCTPLGTIMPDRATIKEKSSGAWESIVLHYLSKLKQVWRPSTPANENEMVHPVTPANRENSAKKFRRVRHNEHRNLHYNKYNPPTPTVSTVPSDFCYSGKRMAFNIVANAIEYGLANGIVSKNGNFFWLSHKLKRNKRLRKKLSTCCFNCRTCRDGLLNRTSLSRSRTTNAKKDNIFTAKSHALAVNRARPKVSKAKSILHTDNLKVKQVASRKLRSRARSARSVQSVKSRKSRVGITTPKSIPKDSVALARSKSKKTVAKTPSILRSEYMSRLIRAKTKDRDCRCPRCLKKYTLQ